MSEKQTTSRRKPPTNGRKFKPGQSGNPKGRPPKVKCIPDILRKIGEEPGTESGDMTKLDVVMHKVFKFAVEGRPWAVQFIADRTEGKPIATIEQESKLEVSWQPLTSDISPTKVKRGSTKRKPDSE